MKRFIAVLMIAMFVLCFVVSPAMAADATPTGAGIGPAIGALAGVMLIAAWPPSIFALIGGLAGGVGILSLQ